MFKLHSLRDTCYFSLRAWNVVVMAESAKFVTLSLTVTSDGGEFCLPQIARRAVGE